MSALNLLFQCRVFTGVENLRVAFSKFGGGGGGKEGGLNQCLVGTYWAPKKELLIRFPMICMSKIDKDEGNLIG